MKLIKKLKTKDCFGQCPYCGFEGNSVLSEGFDGPDDSRFKFYKKEFKCHNCANAYDEIAYAEGYGIDPLGGYSIDYCYLQTDFFVYEYALELKLNWFIDYMHGEDDNE